MTALLRTAVLTHFADLAALCGLEARTLVNAVGLPTRCLSEPDLMVPAERVGRLLEMAATQAREPAFGLRMAESRRLSNLGPLALLVRDEPTLRRALDVLVHHMHLHNEAIAVQVSEDGGLVVIRTEVLSDGGGSPRQATELVVGATCRVLQVMLGVNWHPRLVCFTHAAPPSLAVHQRVLGPAVEFGHEFNGIVCTAADLDTPNPGADPVLARYGHKLLSAATLRSARMTDRVRQLVVLLMPRGLCRIDAAAQHLGINRRTVHRQLLAEGTSFSAIVEAVRLDLARRYVGTATRPLIEVAGLLGFTSPSAFSRWYRSNFGSTAAEHRKVQSGLDVCDTTSPDVNSESPNVKTVPASTDRLSAHPTGAAS